MKEYMYFHEDLDNFSVNTLEQTAYFIPFKKDQNPYADRSESSLLESLNGEWDFSYFESFAKLSESDILSDDFNSKIMVPSVIQLNGYDKPVYSNITYQIPYMPPLVPDENPTCIYHRVYRYVGDGLKRFLVFEGVDSCFYLLINNEMVGYSQVSHSTSTFDITPYLHDGDNDIKVIVLKWCDGTYLEDQDKWRMTGIFRDVYVLSRSEDRVLNYEITSTLDETFSKAMLHIDLKTNTATTLKLYDGETLIAAESVNCSSFVDIKVDNVKLWSAENPNLYNLTIETDYELIGEKVGFREIIVKDGIVYLNGSAIKIRGVNRHEFNEKTGPVMTKEQIVSDLVLLKSSNVNAIRTSHYPDVPYFYQLCDEYGLYIIDEADLEAHGQLDLLCGGNIDPKNVDLDIKFIPIDPMFEKAIIDRMNKLVKRDYNRPCVIFWSLGNESGYGENMKKAAEYIKSIDTSRLVHYESTWMNPTNTSLDPLDMKSNMYTSVIDLYKKDVKEGEKPLFLCEYSHAMGNGPGDIEDYITAFYSIDRLCGGCIWEFNDHGILTGKEEDKKLLAYGGDFGEIQHDGNFCIDGLVDADRKPHSGFLEMKNVYRPVRIYAEDIKKGIYGIFNTMDFMNIKDLYYLHFEVKDNGTLIKEGDLEIDLEPHVFSDFHFPVLTALTGQRLYVRFSVRLKKDMIFASKGTEVCFDQILLMEESKKLKPLKFKGKKILNAKDLLDEVVVSAGDMQYIISNYTGCFTSIHKNGKEQLAEASKISLDRAPIDNDNQILNEWKKAGIFNLSPKMLSKKVLDSGEDIIVKYKFLLAAPASIPVCESEIIYKFYPTGYVNVKINTTIGKNISYIPRFGMKLNLINDYEKLSFFGYGPQESYIDKHNGTYVDLFETTVTDNYPNYLKPQEGGSHFGTQYFSVASNDVVLNVSSEESFSFNAKHFTDDNLRNHSHNFELANENLTEISVDAVMSGVGSCSCGPCLKEEYRAAEKEISINFTMEFNSL